MPKVNRLPTVIRQLQFHGVDLDYRDDRDESAGDCFLCGKEGKFSVNVDTTKWQCWRCREGGNGSSFLEAVWRASVARTSDDELQQLATSRRLLHGSTCKAWGCALSVSSGDWVMPGWSSDGRVIQLYRYLELPRGGWRLLATPDIGHGLFGVGAIDDTATDYFVCEGPWDGMALWEAMAGTKITESGLRMTGNRAVSMLTKCNVVATPGANVWDDRWCALFSGKPVTVIFDNDHPKKCPKTGRDIGRAGHHGTVRVCGSLISSHAPPSEVRYMRWGDQGYSAQWPNGFDVRDWIGGED